MMFAKKRKHRRLYPKTSLHALRSLPSVACVGFVPDEPEIAKIAALTKRFRADEIGIRQAAVVDDISVTAHSTELNKTTPAEDLLIDTLVAFKLKFIFRIVLVPCISPTDA